MNVKKLAIAVVFVIGLVLALILAAKSFGGDVYVGDCSQLGFLGYETIKVGEASKEYCVKLPTGRVFATAVWGRDESGFAVAFRVQPTPRVGFEEIMRGTSDGLEWYSVAGETLTMRRLSMADDRYIQLSPDGSLASIESEGTLEQRTFVIVDTTKNERRCTYVVKGTWFDSGCDRVEQANGATWDIQKENDDFYCGWFHGEMFADDSHCAEFVNNERIP